MEYLSPYNTNQAFKLYVDRYCQKHRITVDVAVTHRLVREYLDMITENNSLEEGR